MRTFWRIWAHATTLYGAFLLIDNQPDRATFFVALGIWIYITNVERSDP